MSYRIVLRNFMLRASMAGENVRDAAKDDIGDSEIMYRDRSFTVGYRIKVTATVQVASLLHQSVMLADISFCRSEGALRKQANLRTTSSNAFLQQLQRVGQDGFVKLIIHGDA